MTTHRPGPTPPDHWLTPANLKAIRDEAKLEQDEMGQAIGYSQSWVSQAEAGKRRIPTELSLSIRRRMSQYFKRKAEEVEKVIQGITDTL